MSSIKQKKEKKQILAQSLILVGLLLAASVIGYGFRWAGFQETNIVIVYILAVLLTSRLTSGYWYGIISGVLATVMFNYFFTMPLFTFKFYNPDYLITFVIMTTVALLTSAMTSRAKLDESLAVHGEEEARNIYKLTNRLTEVTDAETLKRMIQNSAARVLGCQVLCRDYVPEKEKTTGENAPAEVAAAKNEAAAGNGGETEENEFAEGEEPEEDPGIETMEQEESRLAKHTVEMPDGRVYSQRAIHGQHGIQAVLLIPAEIMQSMDEAQERQIAAMLDSTGLAMERLKFREEREKSREEMEKERYRSNLLHTASDGLKTPLLDIMELSEKLMEAEKQGDERYQMAQEIHRDAHWLHSLVWNILSLNRLQEGKIRMERKELELREVVEAEVGRTTELFPGKKIQLQLPEKMVRVLADELMIRQVFLNLLEWAVKHASEAEPLLVSMTAKASAHTVTVKVSGCECAHDVGKAGAYEKDSADEKACRLKLSICESILKAHGGEIQFGEEGGITVSLPISAISSEP